MAPVPFIARHTFAPTLRLIRGVMESADPLKLRRWATQLDTVLAAPVSGTHWRDVALPNCNARWLEVPRARGRRVVLFLHGGAFITETPHLHGSFLARLCQATACNALMPSYRLAPEHRFPAAPDDCLDAYRWLLDQGFQGQHIVLAGDSAGGNLCLGLLPRLRDAGLPLPACAVALSPLTDATFSGGSVVRNDGLDPMFTAASFRRLAPLYFGEETSHDHPLASPLAADLTGLPPLLLLTGSSELLLDDSVRFAQKYPGAQLQVWHDMPHVFPLFDFLPQARQALDGIAGFANEQLEQARRARKTASAEVRPAAAVDTHKASISSTPPPPTSEDKTATPSPDVSETPSPNVPKFMGALSSTGQDTSSQRRGLSTWMLALVSAAVAAIALIWWKWAG